MQFQFFICTKGEIVLKKCKKTALKLAAVFFCILYLSVQALGNTSTFPDVKQDADYAKAVEKLVSLKILSGDENGNFNPDNIITRAEAAVIICRMIGVEDILESTSVFTDVPSSHWAAEYISKAAELEIISGYGDGTFGPDDPVTYEQMIRMLVSAWGYDDLAKKYGGYPDGYLQVAKEFNILNDVPYKKGEYAIRSDVAKMVYNSIYG